MIIEIENFKFKAIIGLLDFERVNKQHVVINLKAEYIYKEDSFIDYVEICDIVKNNIQNSKFELLEDALNSVKDELFNKFNIEYLELKISKPDILKECIVSLSNSWNRV